MPRPRGRVALARVTTPGDPGTTRERVDALRRAMVPGLPVPRYGREWRLGGIVREGPVFAGRLGFERVRGRTELWDEDRQDFRLISLREGRTSPFSLDARSMLVAFQLRSSPQIKRTSFTGAFQAILREGSQDFDWEVDALTVETTLADFVDRVEYVAEFRARLLLPNPDFKGRKRLARIMEGTRAKMLEFAVASDEGIEIDDALVQQSIEHAEDEHGYYIVKGPEQGNEIRYDSRTDEAPPEVQTTQVDQETGEVSFPELRRAVEEQNPED